jgi:hypothetical protein
VPIRLFDTLSNARLPRARAALLRLGAAARSSTGMGPGARTSNGAKKRRAVARRTAKNGHFRAGAKPFS